MKMLPHPAAERSAVDAPLQDQTKLRRNFFSPVLFEAILRRVALQCGIACSARLGGVLPGPSPTAMGKDRD
jgi:hypothetical protein